MMLETATTTTTTVVVGDLTQLTALRAETSPASTCAVMRGTDGGARALPKLQLTAARARISYVRLLSECHDCCVTTARNM